MTRKRKRKSAVSRTKELRAEAAFEKKNQADQQTCKNKATCTLRRTVRPLFPLDGQRRITWTARDSE